MRPTRFRSRFVAQLGAVASLLAVLGATGTASAIEEFPGVIQEFTKSQCLPECTLCHTRLEGGAEFLRPSDLTLPVGVDPAVALPDLGGNRGQGSFFANLIKVGGGDHLPDSEVKLRGYLTKLQSPTTSCNPTATPPAGPCDADGDGTPDVAELTADRNPDSSDKGSKGECHVPQYGCGASIGTLPRESSATERAAALMALLGAGLVLARRVRR